MPASPAAPLSQPWRTVWPTTNSIETPGTMLVTAVISAKEGKITHAFVSPQADGNFLNGTDYANVGLGFGTLKLCEDNSDVGNFYDAFNSTATTDVEKHVPAGGTERSKGRTRSGVPSGASRLRTAQSSPSGAEGRGRMSAPTPYPGPMVNATARASLAKTPRS